LQGRRRQAARAVMVLLSRHGLPPSQIAEPAARPGHAGQRRTPLREKTLWARIASRAARSRVPAG